MEKVNGYGRKCFNQNIDIGKKDNCMIFFKIFTINWGTRYFS